MGDERFGACLKGLMAERDQYDHECSPKCLARALGYRDPSRVRGWLRGDDTPKLNSRRNRTIVSHLSLTATEERALYEAQVRSLRDPAKPRNRSGSQKRNSAPDSNAGSSIEKFVTRGAHPHAPDEPVPAPTGPTGPTVRSSASGEGILEDITRLLEHLPAGTGGEDEANTITLTWQGRDSIEMSESQQARWTAALQSILWHGWRVRHLFRLDRDVERTVQLVEMMLGFVGTGNYFPYYFTTYGTLTPPYDLLVIPGAAAAWLFSSSSRHRVDTGILTRNPAQIAEMAAHAGQLFGQTTQLVSAYFSTDDDEGANAAYLHALQKSEAHAGGRIAVMDGLTAITQPETWFDLQQPSRYDAFPTFEAWRARHASRRMSIIPFKRFVEKYDYYDICTESAVVELCKSGRYFSRLRDTFQPEKQLLLEHLHNVVDLLSRTRYHLALVSDHQRFEGEPNSIHIDTAWTVTGDNSVFLETWIPDEAERLKAASLHITEPIVAEGFREYFRQIWNRIPPISRENDDVIRWFERQIREVEGGADQP